MPPLVAFVGDERWAPENPEVQNGFTIREAFKAALEIGAMELIGWNLEETPEAACAQMAECLAERLGSDLSFDLACLGLGSDGHTAGLFEPIGEPADAGQYRAPDWPHHRLSLSASLLSKSTAACFALRLPGKADAVRRLVRGDISVTSVAAAPTASSLHILSY